MAPKIGTVVAETFYPDQNLDTRGVRRPDITATYPVLSMTN